LKPIILIGGGGHAQSVLSAMSNQTNIIGYADLQANEKLGITYLGTDDKVISTLSPNDYDVHITFVYAGEVNLHLRESIIRKYADYCHATLVAPSAITQNVHIGKGACIMENVVIKANEIGRDTIINTGAIVEHGCVIGSNVLVATGAIICGDVRVGDNCIIGAGAIIRDGISICADTIIGVGAVVVKDITESGTYVGNPAKRIK